jgi:hypothetical protein
MAAAKRNRLPLDAARFISPTAGSQNQGAGGLEGLAQDVGRGGTGQS